jgi:hypothetical protein
MVTREEYLEKGAEYFKVSFTADLSREDADLFANLM